jgi:hypothetical protein
MNDSREIMSCYVSETMRQFATALCISIFNTVSYGIRIRDKPTMGNVTLFD